MWLYTKHGFYSVVEDQRSTDHVFLRARSREHLDAIIDRYPLWLAGAPVLEDPNADYLVRVRLTKVQFAALLNAMAMHIDYTNYKAVHRGKFASMLHDVWERTRRCFER